MASKKPSGLGRGLGALLGDDVMKTESSGSLSLPISQVETCSSQPRKRFDDESLQELADSIGKDWFFVTNSQELAEASYVLPAEYRERFGYVNRIMPTQNLLYIADSLVTNNCRFAGSYAIRRKPVHVLRYTGNVFEKYVQEDYNDMYIGQIDKEMVKIQSGQMRPDQQAFCKEMSYDNPKEPYGVIGEILTKPF